MGAEAGGGGHGDREPQRSVDSGSCRSWGTSWEVWLGLLRQRWGMGSRQSVDRCSFLSSKSLEECWQPCNQGLCFTQSARNPNPLHLLALPFPGGGGLLSTLPQGLVREDVTQNLNISPWPEFSPMPCWNWGRGKWIQRRRGQKQRVR